MLDTNIIFPDLNEGKTKLTIVLPSHSRFAFKTTPQLCYVMGMQVYNKTLNIGLPNIMLSGVILNYELFKIPHPVLNEFFTVTLYIYFDCVNAQVRCYTVCFNKSNKIDLYNFTNYLIKNQILVYPFGFNHILSSNKAVILAPPTYFKHGVMDHVYLNKNTLYTINPFDWKDKRMPGAIKKLGIFISTQRNNIKELNNHTAILASVNKLLRGYNYIILKDLNRLSKASNYSDYEAQKFTDSLNWDSHKCIIIE